MSDPLCSECPLNGHCQKAEPNHANTEVVVVIGQVDRSWVDKGYFCAGHEDTHLLKALRKQGFKRNDVAYVPVIRGQYPEMSRNKFRGRWERKHKKKWGEDAKSPEECCAPYFEAQMLKYPNVIALGPDAAKGVLRGNPGFDKTRGTPVVPSSSKYEQKVVVTWAAWMLRKDPKFVPFFHNDVSKAFRYFQGRIKPVAPKLVEITPLDYADKCASLRVEAEKRGIAFWDIESSPYAYSTNAKGEKRPRYNTLFNPTIILGMGWKDVAYVANFTKGDWDAVARDFVIASYCDILADERIVKVGQNSIGYDEQNMSALYGAVVNNHRDTMKMQRIISPELPKSLAFIAAAYTDAVGWKDGADYSDSTYNAMDCGITHQAYDALLPLLRKSPQRHAYKKLVQGQKDLNRMARVGVPINEEKRAELEDLYEQRRNLNLAEARSVAGPDFNPRSNEQVAKLFYDAWGLPVPDWTNSGAPSTDKHAIIELLSSSLLTAEQRHCIDNIRRFKLASTLLSNYLRPWRASGDIVRDGRIYPGLNASGTLGARPSSSNPNMLVTPRVLKALLCPPEGMALVECDLSGAEYQYVIHAAGITPLLKARDAGADGHGTVLEMIYGKDTAARLQGYPEGGAASGSKGSGLYKEKRQLVKAFVFASLYAAKAGAKHRILRSDKDNQTWNLNNIDLPLSQVQAMDVMFHRAFPELSAWWDSLRDYFDEHGYVRDTNWGLIRPMLNGYKPTEAANFMAQSSTAGYVVDAMHEVIDHPMLKPENGRGLNLTVYDSLWALVPEEDANAACEVLYHAMRVDDKGLKIDAEAEWKDSEGNTHEWSP